MLDFLRILSFLYIMGMSTWTITGGTVLDLVSGFLGILLSVVGLYITVYDMRKESRNKDRKEGK